MSTKSTVLLVVMLGSLWLAGCSNNKNPFPPKTHPESWSQVSSPDFHGNKVIASGYASCTSCHGIDLRGGESHSSCYACHDSYPHQAGWTALRSVGSHGNYIRSAHWSMETCKACHGADYHGGKSGATCYQCHQASDGPQACNVCHGNQENSAPPKDLNDNTLTSALGVGAHQVHVEIYGTCEICHQIPQSFSDPSHIDDTPYAEIVSTWQWNHNTATCAIACHYDANKTYVWNNF
jgi:hypothetical protein